MDKKLRVAIAAGGTAGHVNPALALADELVSRGHEVDFFGQPTRLEARLVPEAGFPFHPIEVTGFDRSRPWTAVTALWRMHTAQRAVGKVFDIQGTPDVAVGFGAYIEMALLRWCRAHGVPYVLHEQNSVPGLANKLSARNATTLCLSFPAARRAFEGKVGPSTQLVLTGNPVRRSVIAATRVAGRAAFGIPADACVLLIFGGSLGARHLNEGIAALKDRLLSIPQLHVLHSTGAEGLDDTRTALCLTEDEARRWQVLPYIDDMGAALAAADLVVSRAGASSIAEIAALAVPSVLVPYPFATENHQDTNAHLLADAGAAVICADSAIDTPEFADDLLGLLGDAPRREAMRLAARGLGGAHAASALADQVEAAARSIG
jgi:UDP-N-acetylglucosamine--N-acetylmuramyl-(pentapeptide) pyrophosphoryl-undecaprenol N-acetylglucosamine transferase